MFILNYVLQMFYNLSDRTDNWKKTKKNLAVLSSYFFQLEKGIASLNW